MWKVSVRILACFMACVIAFNVIAIPRAKASAAVVGTSALATSALASYMTATGVSLTVISGGAAAASAGTASLVSGYAAATGATYEVVTTAIAAGATISGGTIILGAAAVAVLAGIVAWAINEYGVQAGGDSVAVYANDGWMVNGESFPVVYYQSWRDSMNFELNRVYTTGSGNEFYMRWVDGDEIDNGLVLNGERVAGSASFYDASATGFVMAQCAGYGQTDGEVYFIVYKGTFPDDCSVVAQGMSSTSFHFHDLFGERLNEAVNLAVESGYTPKPELASNTQVRIDTGVNPELAPEAVPDAIFESIAASEFAPTYVEEPVADTEPDTGTDPGGDSGEDSETNPDASEDTGLLRRIAIACEALADKILGGIESIFAPDPALMQEISEVFTDKFGFVPTLHHLGTDLLSIDATSTPPVVYIHLEDAEGSIYYGETVKALDMSWYARYKEDVDRIMSGFLWLGFLWLLFKRASAIIQGAEMATDYGMDIHDGYRIRGERNGKHF